MIETTTNKQVYIIQDNPVFAFGIPFFTADNIHCYLYDGETEIELVRGEDFTVESKTDYSTGANVILLRESLVDIEGQKLTITREVPLTQDVNLPEYGKLPVVPLEAQLDKLIMICQQLKDITSRALTVPYGVEDIDTDEIYKMILKTLNEVKEWSETAAGSATAAAGSATAAGNSATAAAGHATAAQGHATAAQGHAANAETSEGNAYNYAATAAEASNSAVTVASEIREIAEEATLNRVTLAFGDWGGDGMYITYNDWTPVETLTKFSDQISEHNTDAMAHDDIRGALTRHNTSALAHSTLFEENELAHEAIMGNFSSTNISTLAHNQYTYRFTRPVNNSIQTIYISQMTEDQVYRARVEVMLQCVENDPDTGYSPGDYAVLAEALPVPLLFTDRILYATGEKLTVIHKNRYKKVDITLHKWNYIFRIWY